MHAIKQICLLMVSFVLAISISLLGAYLDPEFGPVASTFAMLAIIVGLMYFCLAINLLIAKYGCKIQEKFNSSRSRYKTLL